MPAFGPAFRSAKKGTIWDAYDRSKVDGLIRGEKEMDLIAYHNDPRIKTAILAQLALHREADELVKGQYWQFGKGCAIGCTLHSGLHREYEVRFGIPVVLAHLEDRLFEGLPNRRALGWPERFMGSIRPGANLAMVWPRFALWLLTEELPQRAIGHPKCTAAIGEVAALYLEFVETGKSPSVDRWIATRKAAAVADSAGSATADYAVAAADYVAAAAESAVADYAVAAADYVAAAAYASAYAYADQCYVRMADRLIELLEAA